MAGIGAFALVEAALAMFCTVAFDESADIPFMVVTLATIITIVSLIFPSRLRRLPPLISSAVGAGTMAGSYLWLDQFVLPHAMSYRPGILALLVLMSVAVVIRLMAIAMVQAEPTRQQVAQFALQLAVDGALTLLGGGSSSSSDSSSGGGGSFGGGGASGTW
jgi:uncharacterized membrane protein YgcG